MAMEKREGVPYEEAKKRVWLKDSRGLIVADRPEGGISEHKLPFAHQHEPMADLGEIVKKLKPTVLIGAAVRIRRARFDLLVGVVFVANNLVLQHCEIMIAVHSGGPWRVHPRDY